MKKSPLLLVGILCLLVNAYCQQLDSTSTNIQLAEGPILVDGIMDEAAWQGITPISSFWNHRPNDIGKAEAQTTVYLTYDERFLYFGFTCKSLNNQYILESLKRDQFFSDDGIGIVLDPARQKTHGFFFAVNAGGAQSEGMIASTSVDLSWDIAWYSAVKQGTDSSWTAEIAIPFKSIRYQHDQLQWGINFIRNDMKRNQISTWIPFPANFSDVDLGYTGILQWPAPLPQNRSNASVLPYTSGSLNRDYLTADQTRQRVNAGIDAKVALTPSLNLDLTINPDFSTVEVDRQVINLSRFNIFFPERRPFFLENNDLIETFGNWEIKPFFSRRIGLRNGQTIPIAFGARLSGNLSDKWRINLMNTQTTESDGNAAQNYTVAAFQRRVLKRSSFRGFLTNQQQTSTADQEGASFNRVAGAEFNYRSESGNFSSTTAYHRAFLDEPNIEKDRDHWEWTVNYSSKSLRFYTTVFSLGENYLPAMGFTPRLFNYDPLQDSTLRIGYIQNFNWIGWDFYPAAGKQVVYHGPRLRHNYYINSGGEFSESTSSFVYELDMANQSEIDLGVRREEIQLLFPFNPIGQDNKLLPIDRYTFYRYFFDFDSDPRKLFSYGTVIDFGAFYTGHRISLNNYIRLKFRPWMNLELRYIYNWVDLNVYGREGIHLFAPRVEISFSDQLFWTTFFQYNTLAQNMNINSRLQWRYAPMSDLYLVLGNNFGVPDWNTKDLGLVVKFTRWFHL